MNGCRWLMLSGTVALAMLALAVGLGTQASGSAELASIAHAGIPAQEPEGDGTPLRSTVSLLDFEFLDQAITTTHFVVHYTLTNCNPPKNDCLDSDAEAQVTSDTLEEVYDVYVNDPAYDFRTPLGTQPGATRRLHPGPRQRMWRRHVGDAGAIRLHQTRLRMHQTGL
jgi:hypothetical protein